jgi:hypothetical protein
MIISRFTPAIQLLLVCFCTVLAANAIFNEDPLSSMCVRALLYPLSVRWNRMLSRNWKSCQTSRLTIARPPF